MSTTDPATTRRRDRTRTGRKPDLHQDFRKILDDPDIDAVIIGTPDHWHALIMVLACQAGKDVYVEKPMANSIAELDLMVRAARHYNRVVQVGQQQRSGEHWQDVVAFVHSGQLGTIRQVRVWGHYDYGRGQERIPNGTPPANLDYNLYLGPAAEQPYNANRLHNGWRHQWSFGGGLLTDWGVHLLDIVLWAMHVDGPPKSVSSVGGIYAYPERAIETPDTLSVLYEMDGYTISWEHFGGIERGLYDRNYGIAFIGNNGTLVVNRAGWEVVPEIRSGAYLIPPFPERAGRPGNHDLHARNFVDAIKSRQDPACTVEMGRNAAFFAHMGNIAYRTGSRLSWDAANNRFAGNPIADGYLKPEYRKPWTWPNFG
ncbi:MAG: Gfo/Idh/MocA family oxidoreductase [Rhodothermales bacterium]